MKHGQSRSVEYSAYQTAFQRCTNPNSKDWPNYGGRGIEFRFASFEQFFAELGIRPDGMSLDRIDTNGHYESGNVRWSTWSTQMLNRRPLPRARRMKKQIVNNELVVVCKHGHVGKMYICSSGYYRCRTCDYAKNKRARERRAA